MPLNSIGINMYISRHTCSYTYHRKYLCCAWPYYEKRKANTQLRLLLSRDRECKEIDNRTGFEWKQWTQFISRWILRDRKENI